MYVLSIFFRNANEGRPICQGGQSELSGWDRISDQQFGEGAAGKIVQNTTTSFVKHHASLWPGITIRYLQYFRHVKFSWRFSL